MPLSFRCFLTSSLLILIATAPALLPAQTQPSKADPETILIDATAPTTPFPHFWEQMFGSGRAILTLRESYREDLRAVKKATDFKYVRFHAILHDEVGVYNEDEHGNAVYNFAYVDQIYDGLLKNGIRPVVEISFMPKKLAFNPDALHPFWYKQNVSPPKSMEKWDALMTAFAKHLVARYGLDEVSQWYFEMWNEPNIDFWNGIPRQESYFELYDHTARDLKAVSPRLRIGGPATAAAQWVREFLKHAADTNTPVDFVSSHSYADDTVENLFGSGSDGRKDIPKDDRVCLAIDKVRGEIKQSPLPNVPLFWTEWNVQGDNQSRDTPFVGPALANTIRECDGTVDMMSFWTFSDVFEEGGPSDRPFQGSFGLRAEYGINKPSFYDFSLLHKLGTERYANASRNALVTRQPDGKIIIAVWNLVDPDVLNPADRTDRPVTLAFHGLPPKSVITLERVDATHGNPLPTYVAMGSPQYPTATQIEQMNLDSALPPPERLRLEAGALHLTLPPNGLFLVTVQK
jgi:xylan 1,4-beta-xylosidase